MSSEYLKEVVMKELTVAVEEMQDSPKNVDYKEVIRLVLHTLKVESELRRIDCPGHVCKEEKKEVPDDQQLCMQEVDASMGQEEPELPQVKKEREEHHTSQEGEQLVLKQEAGAFMLSPTCEENDHSEDQTLYTKPGQSAAQKESVVNTLVISSVVGAANTDVKHLRVTDDLTQPMRTHTGRKSYECKTCGQHFRTASNLKTHMRIHTGEKPYGCKTCGQHFRTASNLTTHMRIHTGEKPYGCKTCGQHFRHVNSFTSHMRIHTGERPYGCKTCGKHFTHVNSLTAHTRIHTGEKPYGCKTCGKHFRKAGNLATHMRIHTGEKPYECETCGKHFAQVASLTQHMRIHTGEKPYRCKTCGKHFTQASSLTAHMRCTHTDDVF